MRFLTKDDIIARLQDRHLQMIVEGDMDILANAEETAIADIRNYLYPYYDVDGIFSKKEAERNHSVVRWTTTLVLYYIYERVPDSQVPDRVVKNYDDTLGFLFESTDGKKSLDLPRVDNDSDGDIDTKFRYGSINSRY